MYHKAKIGLVHFHWFMWHLKLVNFVQSLHHVIVGKTGKNSKQHIGLSLAKAKHNMNCNYQ